MPRFNRQMNITTLHTFNTDYPADTVEWCPNEGYRNYFVCGTYNLLSNNVEASQPSQRNGSIILFTFDKKTRNFSKVFSLQTAAILDMKWLTSESGNAVPILATANGLGEIDIYVLQSNRLELRASAALGSEGQSLLALSLDWDRSTRTSTRRLLVSDSNGDISIMEYNFEDMTLQTLKIEKTWKAHNFEAWTCSFDKWDPNLVFSGGDDLMLHMYDLRTFECVLTNRSHSAGVTSFLSHPKREHILCTGCYDDRLRLFDTRSMRNPLGEIDLNGGIWRIKSDSYKGDLLLTACMYTNFSVVSLPSLESGENTPKIRAVYNEHKSICYGADWCLDIDEKDELLQNLYMATCSFYDKKLCISNVDLNE